MAIYHLRVKAVQRSKGKSSVACAAYRASEMLKDVRTKQIFDYRKKEGTQLSYIEGYPRGRETLWNHVELSEPREASLVAIEYEVSLPVELTLEQQEELSRLYVKWLCTEYGCVCDASLHDNGSGNPHMHILTTTRAFEVESGQFSKTKLPRDLSGSARKKAGKGPRREEVEKARAWWEKICNGYMEYCGLSARIDRRSYQDRGIVRQNHRHVNFDKIQIQRREKSDGRSPGHKS